MVKVLHASPYNLHSEIDPSQFLGKGFPMVESKHLVIWIASYFNQDLPEISGDLTRECNSKPEQIRKRPL